MYKPPVDSWFLCKMQLRAEVRQLYLGQAKPALRSPEEVLGRIAATADRRSSWIIGVVLISDKTWTIHIADAVASGIGIQPVYDGCTVVAKDVGAWMCSRTLEFADCVPEG